MARSRETAIRQKLPLIYIYTVTAMSGSTDLFPPVSQSHIKQLLDSLRNSIVHKPPFVAGSLQLPPSRLSLLYNITSSEDNHATRLVYADTIYSDLTEL